MKQWHCYSGKLTRKLFISHDEQDIKFLMTNKNFLLIVNSCDPTELRSKSELGFKAFTLFAYLKI